jgi:hypothetical protein
MRGGGSEGSKPRWTSGVPLKRGVTADGVTATAGPGVLARRDIDGGGGIAGPVGSRELDAERGGCTTEAGVAAEREPDDTGGGGGTAALTSTSLGARVCVPLRRTDTAAAGGGGAATEG